MSALSLTDLRKTYKSGLEALKGVNLDVPEGEFFALLGPNGAGKSTLIGIVSSLINKTSGCVRVFGHDLDRNPDVAKRCLGIVPQEINFNQFDRVLNIVVNQAGYYGIPRKVALASAEQCLRQVDLWEKRDSISRHLSGGMKRRLMIARAMVHRPRLLILDEPTAGVDIEIRHTMWDFLRTINRQGTTVILTTHYLEEAESLCRHIAIINKGRIVVNQRMRDLLAEGHTHRYRCRLTQPLATLPSVEGFQFERDDDRTLIVDMPPGTSIHGLFDQLSRQGIQIQEVHSASSRLEQYFLRLIVESSDPGGAHAR